jgi:tetratricopeptide (TPR) repeat protein
MFERGAPEELKVFAELGLKIGEQLQARGGDEETVRTVRESHSYVGMAALEMNNSTLGMFHIQKWLDALLERESASNVPILDYELGYAYNELGVAYGFRNMVDEAAKAFLRSIEIFQGTSDYEDTMLGWPEPNLGFIYWLQGKLEEAERVFVEILDIHAAAWGVDDTKSFK